MMFQHVLVMMGGLWPFDGLPDPPADAPDAMVQATSKVFSAFKWGGLAVAVICLISAVVAFAWRNYRGEGGAEMSTRLIAIVALIFVASSAVSIVGWVLA